MRSLELGAIELRYAKPLLVIVVGVVVWAALAVYLAFYGLWMSAVAASGDTPAFYNWAVSQIESKNRGNTAFVLLEDGQVVKRFFGGAQEGINEHTLFPTASFSKWITALSVMSLVESNRLDLDTPVSHYLTRWQLPNSTFNNEKVTVRRLLSHTAGLTDGLGFGDYEADEAIPRVELELKNPRASSGEDVEIVVGIEPGTEFQYSGGGYLILQLVVEEVSGVAFVDFVERVLLEPLGMSRSSYRFLGNLENASLSYNVDGSVAPTFQYASPAATGFASTASDLSKLVEALVKRPEALPLKSATVEAMREPHGFMMGAAVWGLGTILFVQAPNGDYVFGHDGANDPAINATLRINPETSDGIVMLVSGHPTLASNIGSEWVLWQTGYPGLLLIERAIKSAAIPIAIGSLLMILLVFLWSRKSS